MPSGKSLDSATSGNSSGTRITFAPGTSFEGRASSNRWKKTSSVALEDTFILRPVNSDEQRPLTKFCLPKATLPSLRYLSVTHEDFLDPRFAEDIVKNYGIPKYFFRSKSNLLVSRPASTCFPGDASKDGLSEAEVTGNTQYDAPVEKPNDMDKKDFSDTGRRREKQVEPAKNKVTSGTRLPVVCSSQQTTKYIHDLHTPKVVPGLESSSKRKYEDVGTRRDSGDGSRPLLPSVAGIPLFKPLIGQKYTQARFCPHMNPWRSLQMESELDKLVDQKKRCGLQRYARLMDPSQAALHAAQAPRIESGTSLLS